MKILKIRFENIHSLKDVQEIDFGEGVLAEAGLFAITGPTGSGKSTLLDIITLALFNRIARMDKAISNTILEDDGSIMTRNMKSCFAEVEYRVNGKEYRSHWSIERNRNNNLNSRKQELVDIATGTILETGTKTPDRNQQIIGLSYEQFIKAMVLSQGEFSKLLQAPRNERNKLLEDITGARSYREIGRAVYSRYSSLKEKVKLKESGLETIQILSDEEVAEKKLKLESLNHSKPKVEKTYEQASERIKTRNDLLQKLEEEKTLLKNKNILKERQELFKESKARLEKHEQFSKYAPLLRDYDLIKTEIKKALEKLSDLKKQENEEISSQEKILESIFEFCGERSEVHTAHELLEKFRGKINELLTRENAQKREAELHQNQIQTSGKNIAVLGYSFPKVQKYDLFISQFERLHNQIQQDVAQSGLKQLDELNIKLESLRNSHEIALELLMKKEKWQSLEKNFKKLKDEIKNTTSTISEDEGTISNLTSEIKSLEEIVKAETALLEHQRKHQSLEQHRAQLQPNEPCPLCGSLEHPYALGAPVFDIKEETLKEKQRLLKTKSELVISLQQKINFSTASIARLEQELKMLLPEFDKQNAELISLGKKLQWDPVEEIEILQTKRTEILQQIRLLEKSKSAFQAMDHCKQLQITVENWQKAIENFNSYNSERVKLYSGNGIDRETSALANKLTQNISSINHLQKQQKEVNIALENIQAEEKKKKQKLEQTISEEKLESIEALQSLILDEETAAKFRRTDNMLKDGASRLSEAENRLNNELQNLRSKDDSSVTLEQLQEQFIHAKDIWSKLNMELGQVSESLRQDAEMREKQQQVMKELELLKKDQSLWKTMNDLIGDATGNKFSNFVQDLTLEQLIGFANRRLSEFSDRYLLDIPTAEEADKSDTLKVFDRYMGNARRSVRTLSGGETFLVSLAMAFALSDIASRNVKIESLFIDEGFGTLDPETLDQAISILEKMQNEGDRSVGVISHVSALKERITTQIQLEKSSLGYSTTRIVQ